MSELQSVPVDYQPDFTIGDRLRQIAAAAGASKFGRAAIAGILVAGSGAATFGVEEISRPAAAYADTVDDALAAYPDKNDTCQPADVISPAQKPTAASPYVSCRYYDWGVPTGSGFKLNSDRGYGYRNCTDWAAWRVSNASGGKASLPTNWGDAKTWYDKAPASEKSTTPKPGEVAVNTDGTYGHVAFVESVSPDGKSMVISEYNYDMDGHGDKRTVNVGTEFAKFVDLGIDPVTLNPPPADTDHDGIPDSQDDCPATPGAPGFSYYGCPAYDPSKTNPALTSEIDGNTAVSSWGNGRLDVYRRNPDDTVSHNWFDGGHWQPDWSDNLGGNIVGKPGAVSWGYGRIDLFGIGPDGKLKHKFLDPGMPWSGWETLDQYPNTPSCLKDGVSVTSDAPQNLHIVAHGCDNAVKHFWLHNNQWQSWDDLGGYVIGPPTITSWGPGRLDVFARGGDNHIYTKIVDQNGWSGWAQMNTSDCISAAPAVTSPGYQRLDLFARGCTSNELLHRSFRVINGIGQWLQWQEYGCNIAEAPSAVSMNPTRMDVISTDPGGNTTQFYFDRNWPATDVLQVLRQWWAAPQEEDRKSYLLP